MDLDKFEQFSRLDVSGILRNIEEFPDQLKTAAIEMESFALPAHYAQSNHIILLGVGSNYIANCLIQNLAKDSTIPITVCHGITLPNFITGKTLVIASSYSGDTEETAAGFDLAAKRGAKLIAITSGGMLASYARKYKAPIYEISYGSAPRVSLGYTIASLYAIAMKLGILEKDSEKIPESAALVKGFLQKIKADVVMSKNNSKQLALRLKNRIPIIIGSGTMLPVATRFADQINETALTMSFYQSLARLRHHGIRGINFPAKLQDKIIYIFLTSNFAPAKEEEVYSEISSLFNRRGIPHEVISIEPPGSRLAEALCAIQLADYTAYYLSIINDNNPQQSHEA
jgi:glucose/mannose-6-phosphate isomerase